MKSRKRYMALVDPDDRREGEVRFDPKYNEDENWYEGGQLIFKWYDPRNNERGGLAPRKVERIVDLANKALENELG